MNLKDFVETDDFYALSNDAKLLYLYLLIYKDENNLVNCSNLLCIVLHVGGTEFSQLADIGLIKLGEDEEPITVIQKEGFNWQTED